MKKKCIAMILSLFGIGHIPIMPGTFGSAAVLPFLILMSRYPLAREFHLIILIISVIVFSFMIKIYQEETQTHDASMIVIDEALGMYLGWIIIGTSSIPIIIALFFLFRFFDITKIWPASYFDKLDTGLGVIADDLIAGAYSGVILLIYSKMY